MVKSLLPTDQTQTRSLYCEIPTIANAPHQAKIDKGAFNNGRRALSSTTSCRATLLESQIYPMGINIPRTDYFSMDKNEERLMNSPRILMLEMEENIQGCLQCYRDCLRTFSRLLTLESDAELANPEQLHLLLVCDDVCRMCAEFYTPLFRISPACREPVLCRFAGDPSRFGTTCGHRPLS
jgi:hypothetical protein